MKLCEDFLSMLGFPIYLFWCLAKPKSNLLCNWMLIKSPKKKKFAWRIQKSLSGKTIQTLKVPETFFRILRLPKNFFGSLEKVLLGSSESWNIDSSLYNAKCRQQIQKHFSGKLNQTLELSKNCLAILEFPINFFWSLPKA